MNTLGIRSIVISGHLRYVSKKLSIVFPTFLLTVCCALSACTILSTYPQPAEAAVIPGSVTSIAVSNVGRNACGIAPVTFGQPFRRGDVPKRKTITAYLGKRVLPTQVNVKARNPDGSLRHAILTILVPCGHLHGGADVSLVVHRFNRGGLPKPQVSIRDLLKTRFSARVTLRIHGKPWSLSVRPILRKIIKRHMHNCTTNSSLCRQWLRGPLVSEWVVGGAVRNAEGQPHPHLAVYFAIRAYGPLPVKRVRVDVIVENDWAYQSNPKNYHYNATVDVGGKQVYSVRDLTHYRQARWHKVFWWGQPDTLYAELNSNYLQESRAVPRYQSVMVTRRFLSNIRQSCAPMQPCDQTPHMAMTGAQSAIGPLPRWSSVYVVDPSYRAYRWMLANSDALGAYGIHYREKSTGQPLSVINHPCATLILASRTPLCPDSVDRFPKCNNDCKSPLLANESHHPAPAYVAYLVTGDWYYMEELEFWADWVVFWQNPAYRGLSQGLIEHTQVRGQAWALRTLGDAAYILPDKSPLKHYFYRAVENNIRWYTKHYPDNSNANQLHIITNPDLSVIGYSNHGVRKTGYAVWMQSFFNWELGNLVDQGFPGAKRLRDWFATFQIRLMTSRTYCWELASTYEIRVRDTQYSPLYRTLGEVYRKTFPSLSGIACDKRDAINIAMRKRKSRRYFTYPPGTMIGYPLSPTGFPANFQIGLAASVSSKLPDSKEAWRKFMSRTDPSNYTNTPQFAVIPRRGFYLGNSHSR